MRRRRLVRALWLLAAPIVACTEPDVRTPKTLVLLAGDAQVAEVGTQLPVPIEVQVADSFGRPVPRVTVTFQVTTASPPGFTAGTVTPATAETSESGIARTQWTLGTAAGEQTLRVWVGTTGSETTPHADVRAIAQPGGVVSLARTSDPVIAITVGDSVPVAVAAADRYGNATSTFGRLTWRVLDPAVALVSRADVPPDHAAIVIARAAGTTVLEARDPTAGALPFELRTYVGPGREIAFASGDGISLMSADGATVTVLGPGADPAWSPDGRQITFTGPGAVYVMNADGSGARALTDPSTIPGPMQPAWSPDGRKIAFVAASEEPLTRRVRNAVHVMNADGSAPTVVAGIQCAQACTGTLGSQRPTWSPDGTRIAFSWRTVSCLGGNFGAVYVVNPDGSGLRPIAPDVGYSTNPAWSPDGRRVAFQSARGNTMSGCFELGLSDLYAADVDATVVTRLTRAATSKASSTLPTWSPDRRIAFVATAPFGGGLFVMNADGSEVRRVFTMTGGLARPAWRP